MDGLGAASDADRQAHPNQTVNAVNGVITAVNPVGTITVMQTKADRPVAAAVYTVTLAREVHGRPRVMSGATGYGAGDWLARRDDAGGEDHDREGLRRRGALRAARAGAGTGGAG